MCEADVIIQKNIILAIRTTDCISFLFLNEDDNIIGVAHGGWGGAKLYIIEKLA